MDALVQAEADFAALGDYQDSAEKVKQATYQQAQVLYDSGNYAVVRVLFQGLADYSDAADRAQACTYQEGKGGALYDAGD